MLKKFKRKFCTYAFTCYVCTKSFHEKPTCRLAYKKTNFGAKNKTFMIFILSFLYRPPKISFFAKLYERIWIIEMYMQKNSFEFSDT
jgi:hypothetical protein